MLDFQKTGLLDEVVLVGSWCLDFYRNDLVKENPFSIPSAKTMDADFLLPKRPEMKSSVDIASILEPYDFAIEIDRTSKKTLFLHPELKIEFLTEQSRKDAPYHEFLNLGVVAEELPYMTIPFQYNYKSTFKDLIVQIPTPEAFALHKMLVIPRRKDAEKREKDVETVEGLLLHFEQNPDHLERLREVHDGFSKGWQKTIAKVIQEYDIDFPLT